MFCRYCGQSLPDTAWFCNHCGAQLKTEQQMEQPTECVRPRSTEKKWVPALMIGCLSLILVGCGFYILTTLSRRNTEEASEPVSQEQGLPISEDSQTGINEHPNDNINTDLKNDAQTVNTEETPGVAMINEIAEAGLWEAADPAVPVLAEQDPDAFRWTEGAPDWSYGALPDWEGHRLVSVSISSDYPEIIQFSYNGNSPLPCEMSDSGDASYKYTYDDKNRVILTECFISGHHYIDPVVREYNEENQLIMEQMTEGNTVEYDYTYDSAGNMVRSRLNTGWEADDVEYLYNADNLISSSVHTRYSVESVWEDGRFQTLSASDPEVVGQRSYEYSNDGRIHRSVLDTNGDHDIYIYNFDDDGFLDSISCTNDSFGERSYQYDRCYRITDYNIQICDAAGYSAVDIWIGTGERELIYDDDGFLTEIVYTDGRTVKLTYEGNDEIDDSQNDGWAHVYQGILDDYYDVFAYRNASGSDYYNEASIFGYLYETNSNAELYYGLADLDQNEIPELLLGYSEAAYSDKIRLGSIYTTNETQAFELLYGGKRAFISVKEDGSILERGSYGAAYQVNEQYRIGDDGISLELAQSLSTSDGPAFYLDDNEISQDAYYDALSVMTEDVPDYDIHWRPLNEDTRIAYTD